LKSHFYEFTSADVRRVILPPLLGLLSLAVVLHLGALARVLPAPRPILDADRTVLLHQAAAARRVSTANILFVGDSSCMMDVSVPLLNRLLPQGSQTLNLGTLSYLDLPAMGDLVQNFNQVNPSRPQLVLLLMHPEALRRSGASEAHIQIIRDFYLGIDSDKAGKAWRRIAGLSIFSGRIHSRLIPIPLPGEFAFEYGFNFGLWNYLSAHGGSAVDPAQYSPAPNQGNAEYRLAKSLEAASQHFKQEIPPRCKLVIGITPAPASFVLPNYPQQHQKNAGTVADLDKVGRGVGRSSANFARRIIRQHDASEPGWRRGLHQALG